ncbi:hypothetical protein BH23BAC2_BH23BAC2_23420 [soil metagenome]
MKILYIHGLDSKLSEDKRGILEKFGTVVTPDIDYYTNPDAIESILSQMEGKAIDLVLGSSMGGFAGYYVSTALNLPALLFNPALSRRTVKQNIPPIKIKSPVKKHFLLGALDDVVNPGETLNFIAHNYNNFTNFHLHIMPDLTHNIPEDVFETEVMLFIEKFKKL